MRAPEDARLFLEALTGDAATRVTFQTFDDSPAKRPWLVRRLHGSIAEHAQTLAALNDKGAHIGVMVNAGDLAGRSAHNVVALRALWIDEDQPKRRPFKLAPSIVVRSKRGAHAYWLLQPEAPIERFTASQRQLAKYYGTDAAVSDLAHVMRLPGFWHRKAEPFEVELLHADGSMRYELEAVVAAHPVSRVHPRAWRNAVASIAACADAFTRYRAWADSRVIAEGSRNRTAFSIAAEGFRRGLSKPSIEQVVCSFCERAGIPREARSVIVSAGRYHARRTG
jgi:hypothetical protein